MYVERSVFRFLAAVLIDVFPQAYDQHLNMVLADVEETVTTVELDEETFEEIYKASCFYPICIILLYTIIYNYRVHEELFLCYLLEAMESS